MKKKNSKEESKTEWERVDALQDEDIDYSDIPELNDDFFEKATFVPAKQTVTIRLDTDVITWLKEGGKGYQPRANKILRSVMEARQKAPAEPVKKRAGGR